MKDGAEPKRLVDPKTRRVYRVVGAVQPLTEPPVALHKAKPDNLVLIPASQLPFKDEWQQLAN